MGAQYICAFTAVPSQFIVGSAANGIIKNRRCRCTARAPEIL